MAPSCMGSKDGKFSFIGIALAKIAAGRLYFGSFHFGDLPVFMLEAPLRHLIFLLGLLFVILSSGSLQCALNCYESQLADETNSALVITCHPLTFELEALPQVADCCHSAHATSQAKGEPQLFSLTAGQLMAWPGSRSYAPLFRRPEPLQQAPFVLVAQRMPEQHALFPLRLEQIRTTILLM